MEISSKENYQPLRSEPPLSITAITFQTAPSDPSCSGVFCRTADNVIASPEWQAGDSYVKPVLFISETLKKINMGLTVNVNTSSSPTAVVPVTLYLRNQDRCLFNGELSQQYNLSPGQSQIVLTISDPNIQSVNKISKQSANLQFSYSFQDGKRVTMQQFLMQVYVLPKTPSFPISLKENMEKYYPLLDLIDIILSQSNASSDDQVLILLSSIYENQQLRFSPNDNDMSKFSELQHEFIPSDPQIRPFIFDFIQFNLKQFLLEYALTTTHLNVTSDVYALLLMYGMCLIGKQATISYIIPESENNSGSFTTRELCSAGSASVKQQFTLSYQAVVKADGLIYDASIKQIAEGQTESGMEFLAGLIFEKTVYEDQEGYVDRVFLAQTEAAPGGITNNITIDGFVCQITNVYNNPLEGLTENAQFTPPNKTKVLLNRSIKQARSHTDLGEVVIDFSIEHPRANQNTMVNVLYCNNSNPQDHQNYNYVFQEARNKDGMVNVRLPFSGTICLRPNYKILKVDLLGVYLALSTNEQTIAYDKEDYSSERFTWEIHTGLKADPNSPDDRTYVTWNFSSEWAQTFAKDLNESVVFNIIARIPLVIRKVNDDGTQEQPFELRLFLGSDCGEDTSNCLIKQSPKINVTFRYSDVKKEQLDQLDQAPSAEAVKD